MKKITFTLFLILNFCFISFAQESKYSFKYGFLIEYGETKSVMDLKGDNKTEYNLNSETIIEKLDYSDLLINASAEYFFNNFSVGAALPIRRQTLSYQSRNEFNDSSAFKYDYSLTQVDNVELSLKRHFQHNNTFYSASVSAKIPFKSSNSIYEQNGYDFYYGGAFELTIGGAFVKYYKNINLSSSLYYNYRSLELADQALYNIGIAFTKVENTAIGIFINGAQSLKSFKNSGEFNPKYVSNQEDYADIGLKFDINFADNLFTEFSYRARFMGKKTYYKNAVSLNISYLL